MEGFGLRNGGRFTKSWCRSCESEAFTARYHADRPRYAASYWRSWLKSQYGLTPDDYQEMLTRQRGACAICGSSDPGANRRYFCVDHDHETALVRGLLCNSCNKGLGTFADDPERLDRAAAYLRAAATRQEEP